MISKRIHIYGQLQTVACDGNCAKAWGIQARPRTMLSTNIDDFVYLPDGALGMAPPPGKTEIIAEGDDIKPSATRLTDGSLMNKWCSRQCERSVISPDEVPVLRDMEHPRPNMPVTTITTTPDGLPPPSPASFITTGPASIIPHRPDSMNQGQEEIIRITPDNRVFMRGSHDDMIEVSLSDFELGLLKSRDPIDIIRGLTVIVAASRRLKKLPEEHHAKE